MKIRASDELIINHFRLSGKIQIPSYSHISHWMPSLAGILLSLTMGVLPITVKISGEIFPWRGMSRCVWGVCSLVPRCQVHFEGWPGSIKSAGRS